MPGRADGPGAEGLDPPAIAFADVERTRQRSVFGLYPFPAGIVRPAGEWNDARLVVRGNHVEHWLNGTMVVEYELWSDDWNARKAAGKWAEVPTYGIAEIGHIGLQDHGGLTLFRNIKIREL